LLPASLVAAADVSITSVGGPLSVPISATLMGFSGSFGAAAVAIGVHPVTIAMVTGIALQGFAECFLSPRYLEFASKLAPAGQEGLYMGYAHLNTFFAWFLGFILSGYLLDAFCPDPARLSAADQAMRLAALAGNGPFPAAYAHAHVIWWVFAGVGVTAFAALMILQRTARNTSS
jgi:dipeptide/tripeptide permease